MQLLCKVYSMFLTRSEIYSFERFHPAMLIKDPEFEPGAVTPISHSTL